jgi:hypothetical protein
VARRSGGVSCGAIAVATGFGGRRFGRTLIVTCGRCARISSMMLSAAK